MRQIMQRESSRSTRAPSVHARKTPMTAKKVSPIDPRVACHPSIIPAQALGPSGALPDTLHRVTTRGKLYTCLFAQSGRGLRAPMPSGKSGEQIASAMGLIWNQREDRYSEIFTEETARAKEIEMSSIDGRQLHKHQILISGTED